MAAEINWGFDKVKEGQKTTSEINWGFDKDIGDKEEQDQFIKADPATEDADAIESWAQDQDKMKNLSIYMEQRYGEEGYKQPNESNTDYVKRFLTHARGIENNSMRLMQQIDYLREASDDQRIAFGAVYDEYNKLPYFADGTARAVKDTLTQLVFDPINIFSLGIGRVAASTVGKVAVKEGLKKYIPKTVAKNAIAKGALTGAVGGGITGVGFDAGLQEVERKGYVGDAKPEDKLKIDRLYKSGLIGAGLGGALGGVGSIGAVKSAKQLAIEGAKRPKSLTSTADATASKNAKEGSFDPLTGLNATLKFTDDELDNLKKLKAKKEKGLDPSEKDALKGHAFLQPEVLTSLSVKMTKVVENLAKETNGTDMDILKKHPAVFNKKGEQVEGKKVFEMVQDVLVELSGPDVFNKKGQRKRGIDVDALERSIVKSGMTKEEFVDFLEITQAQGYDIGSLIRGSVSEGATKMGAGGPLGKMRKVLHDLPEEQKNRLNKLYGTPEDTSSILGTGYRWLRKADRERRAMMVTQIATTARNVATAISVVNFQTAASLMEASIYHFSKSLRKKQTGKNINPNKDFRQSLTEIWKDSFGLLSSITNQQNSDDLARFVLRHNPKQQKALLRTVQEAGSDADLSRFTMFFNRLNLAQDVFFRRAFFTHSVDKKLRRAGIGDKAKNIYTKKERELLKLKDNDFVSGIDYLLKTDKDVPLDILKGSVDDALTNTFALMPKNGPARNIIKAIEGLPGVPVFGTGEFPFARFMANAIAFQFKYSPFNAAVALTNGIGFLRRKNKGLIKAKDLDLENDRALQDFAKRFSESVVGGAALATAYYYRLQNQDTKWYEGRSKDGKTIDLRPFFPLAPYLIIGDLAVKWSKGETIKLTMIGDITEGLTGSQFRAGAASYSLNKFYELFGNPDSISAKEQVGEMFGTYMGEIMGGFFTPGRVLKDIVATFDEESAIVRDPRQIEGEGFERGFDAFLKTTFHKNLPFLEKSLPELQLPTREGTIYRQSPFYGQTLGLRFIQKRTPEERELVRLGFENYEIMRTTGDKKADDLIKKQLAPLIVTFLKPVLNSASYKNFSEPQKRNYVNKYLQDLRADAKSIAKAIAQAESIKDDKPFTPFDRVEYLRLSKDAKALAEEYFQDEYGKSVAETQYYKLGKEIGLMLQKAYSP